MNRKIIWPILVSLVSAGLLSLLASSDPDGLEQVAEQLGFARTATTEPLLPALAPDYLMPGLKNQALATSLAGISGTLLVLILGWGLGKFLGKSASRRTRS